MTNYRLDPKPEEQAVLDATNEFLGNASLVPTQIGEKLRVIATSTGRGQAAEAIARQYPNSEVTLWYIDQFHQQRAIQHAQWKATVPTESHSSLVSGSNHQTTPPIQTVIEIAPPSNLNVEIGRAHV